MARKKTERELIIPRGWRTNWKRRAAISYRIRVCLKMLVRASTGKSPSAEPQTRDFWNVIKPLSNQRFLCLISSRTEASQYFRIGVTTLWCLTQSRKISSIQIGSRRMNGEDDLIKFVQANLSGFRALLSWASSSYSKMQDYRSLMQRAPLFCIDS